MSDHDIARKNLGIPPDCARCKWFRTNYKDEKLGHPFCIYGPAHGVGVAQVQGREVWGWWAHLARKLRACGEEGKYWEPRDE